MGTLSTEGLLLCLIIEFSYNLSIHMATQTPAMKSGCAVDELCTSEIGFSTSIFHTPWILEHAERC